jgi:hypothetical protein
MHTTQVKFSNRYRDVYLFTQEANQIKWEGPFQWYRTSEDKDGRLTMVDPSGGPYIEIGSKMEYIAPEFKNLFVSALAWQDGSVIITCNESDS